LYVQVFIISKPNTGSSPKGTGSTVGNDTKSSGKYPKFQENILPVAFIGGLHKIQVVMCSNLVEVHAKKVNLVGT